jgi:outer membrane protein OmpA-like peptidoglycan-associated protein
MKKIILFIVLSIYTTFCQAQIQNKEIEMNAESANPFLKFTRAIQFNISTTELSDVYEDEFKSIIKLIKDFESQGNYTFEISCHTDSVGAKEKNKILSQQRADRIKSILVKSGIEENLLLAIGYGEERPVDSNKTSSGRIANRRIEIIPVKI